VTTTFDLTGRRVLVTGASSGIGAETCRAVVRAGAAVAMLARRKERLDELRAELGDRAHAVACDVTDLDGLKAAVDESATLLGGIDAVVAVAGQSMVGSLASGDPEGWRNLLALNVLGPLAAARFALPHFPADGKRDVVVLGSTGGMNVLAGAGAYAASKAGLHTACEALRLELAPEGIRVGVVKPGYFETEILVANVVFNGDAPRTPLPPLFIDGGQIGQPDIVADAVVYMLNQPDGIAINELVIRPTGQLFP